jgi:hypothetical protein
VHVTAYKSIFAAVLMPLVLLVVARPLRAQDEPQAPIEDKPKPAGTSVPIPAMDAGDDQNSEPNNTLRPDNTPVTGIQDATLGSPETRHSYWVPGVQWFGSIQSNSYNQTPNSGWLMNNYFLGNLSLLKVWSRSQLALNYSGGGFLSTDSIQGNGWYQSLALSQTFERNRWVVQILDLFTYSPTSTFGFGGGVGGTGVGGSLGSTIPPINGAYVPNQSSYGAVGPRYSNVTALQLTYATSPRGSITASGSYGFLRFVDPGGLNDNSTTATVGYNYALTHEQSIGAFYRFSGYHYPGQPQAFGNQSQAYGNQSFNIAYSRKLTGLMALRLYAGPSITSSRVSAGSQSSQIGANAGVSFTYAVKDGGLSGSYVHVLGGGSGVFTAGNLDEVSLDATHKLSRVWTGWVGFGYAHNSSAVNSTAASSGASYTSWFVNGGVGRPLSESTRFMIGYYATKGGYGQSGCAGSSCSASQNSNTFTNYVTINLQWHARPFVLP